MKISGLIVTLLLIASAASADIVKWQDADGVTHYTNIPAEIPKDEQANAVVVVDELARRQPDTNDVTAAAPPAAPAEPAREAQVIYDRTALADVYLEGLERGLESARTGAQGGSVQINGPLAVATTSAPPAYPYLPPYYPPLVTTSFDRGRSRFLTLRLLLQDQFAIDREGPYTYGGRLDFLPLSVNLNPFLPRGLPHAAPRPTRVVTH